MNSKRGILASAIGLSLLASPVLGALEESVAVVKPPWTKNCAALNKKYPHGVGKAKAVDKTSSTRVTNFKRSDKIYNQAMSFNKGLDRDKDKIACEKR